MRDLITEPAWQEKDMGMALPDTRHACSMCLPTWNSVIGYEEKREKVIRSLQAGYPRFVLHPQTARLFQVVTEAVGEAGTKVVVFPSSLVAQRAQRYVEKTTGSASRIVSYEGVQALIVPEKDYPTALEYWRYTGEVISSRHAEDILNGIEAKECDLSELLKSLAAIAEVDAEDIFIYESGMAAMFASFRAISEINPSKKSLQLEFPYVDAMRVQKFLGSGVVFLNEARGESFDEALGRIASGEFSAVFCEAPSNPLLRVVDLERVASACRDGNVPLVVDDTIASSYNVRVDDFADLVTTSLTKWISGKGDVMAGQLRVNKNSIHYEQFTSFFNGDCPEQSRLYESDARILSKNVLGFGDRIKKVNVTGEKLADYLLEHSAVEQIWYPKFTTSEFYHNIRTPHGGFGGLISFTLKNAKKAQKFFDLLEISKGPSLGTEFSLACPYTLLAHYDELEWAEGCGVDRNLIRISVGLESEEELLSRFDRAFAAI